MNKEVVHSTQNKLGKGNKKVVSKTTSRLPKEKDIIDRIESIIPDFVGLKQTDKWSRFDAFNDKVLIEIKCRKAEHCIYNDTMMEKAKINEIGAMAKNSNRKLYYAVYNQENDRVYVWDLFKMKDEDYDFNWRDQECRRNNYGYNYIMKRVGSLGWKDASFWVPYQS